MIDESKFSKDMQLLSDVIGAELTIKVMAKLGKLSIYIPAPDVQTITYYLEKNGGDIKKTAQLLSVSMSTVYRAIRVTTELDGQLTIFDAIARLEQSNNQ